MVIIRTVLEDIIKEVRVEAIIDIPELGEIGVGRGVESMRREGRIKGREIIGRTRALISRLIRRKMVIKTIIGAIKIGIERSR
jgi:hypothetical protein